MKDLLFLSHCVPGPPDKGEKVRAHYELLRLAREYRVHLACFARDKAEVEAAHALKTHCASVYVERLVRPFMLAKAASKFALGGCLNAAFYSSTGMQRHAAELARRVPLRATFAYTAVMLQHAPQSVPTLLDMVDVDSEKWFQYSCSRWPQTLYRAEARRLRQVEQDCVRAAAATMVTTENEAELLRQIASGTPTTSMENGVDGNYFDGLARPLPAALQAIPFVVFVGTMDYHPNIEGARRFGDGAFPELRRRIPGLEFWIVGRNPSEAIRRLRRREGVRVLGAVPDVRPYLSAARAVVAPLQVARGIQNKVLDALAMGREVFASEAVCQTLGERPTGVTRCASAQDFIEAIERACSQTPRCDSGIRAAACRRYSWGVNLEKLVCELRGLVAANEGVSVG